MALAGLAEDEGLDALDEIVAAQILEPRGAESYAFTHALIRHALYDGLTPSRRSRLHRRVAEALEGAHGTAAQATAAEIAVQYHRSAALLGAERGVDYALEAAGRAQETGAHDEAATFVRMALDMLPGGDDRRPRLLGRLGIVLGWALAFDEAAEVASQAGDAIAEVESKQAAAEYLSDAAYVCAQAGGTGPSWTLARHGLNYASSRDTAWARLVAFDHQRREAEDPEYPGIPIDSAERRESAAILRSAHLDPLGPAPMEAAFESLEEAGSSANLILLILWAGEYRSCLPLLQSEAEEAESLGRLLRSARAWASVSYCQGALGRLVEARESFEKAQALAARLGAPVPGILYPQQLLCAAVGEGWEPLAGTFAFLASSRDPGLAWALGFVYAGQCQAAAHLGQPEEALGALGRLVPWLERAPAWTIGFSNMVCGAAEALWLLERLDHGDVVERVLREKLLPADFRYAMVDSRLSLARLCALTGRHDEATEWFAEARRVLDEQQARPLRAICDYDEALMHARRAGPGDAGRARPLLEAAQAQFEAIGMTGWIRRAGELEERLETV